MFVKQISVFLENKPGRLSNLTSVLAKNDVDIFYITIAETGDYGVIRCVTKNNDKAVAVLQAAGFTVSVTELVGVEICDKPGALNEVLQFFAEKNIQIEYLYSFSRDANKSAAILIKIDNAEGAVKQIKKAGFNLITDLTK